VHGIQKGHEVAGDARRGAPDDVVVEDEAANLEWLAVHPFEVAIERPRHGDLFPGDLDQAIDLGGIAPEGVRSANQAYKGEDGEAGRGPDLVELAQDLDVTGIQADLFFGFAKRRVEKRRILGGPFSPREGDLPPVMVQGLAALRVK